ncbi:hypothetical protein P7C70_g2405, partial [Phenoliferia sp. Uapishka_3]
MARPTSDPAHVRWLELALSEAEKCTATPTAFCVGCVIVSHATSTSPSVLLSTGYSRELPGNTHAEANAIDKLFASDPTRAASLLKGASIYTTMEPCSVRLSGNKPCVERCIEMGFANVYMGVEEPNDFVACQGTRKLRECGADVWVVVREGLREACLAEARRGHDIQ